MPKFILIDHSLKGLGGHHYEYALHVGRAAQAAGFDVIVAAHCRFTDRALMPQEWTIFSPYRHSTYTSDTAIGSPPWSQTSAASSASQSADREPHEGKSDWRRRWSDWRIHRRCTSLSATFQRGTRALLRGVVLERGDHVFVPTLNELDFRGLLQYLDSDSSTRQADWHLQFHYAVAGDKASDEYRRLQLQEVFDRCRKMLASHRLHLYGTTQGLADHFRRLTGLNFRCLPYPVNPEFQRRERRPNDGPLTITCLGGVRDEKGLPAVSAILDELWTDYFATGRLELVVQARRASALPAEVRRRMADASAPTAIRIAPHPLDSSAYMRLVQHSDIGLLMYDPRRYRDRCSGVLVEMLTAGVPVIVPGGCWLSEQIQAEIQKHKQQAAVPRGAVGLIAAEPAQAPALVRDMVGHYDHYRRTAGEFAACWTQWHNPNRVVAELLAQTQAWRLPAAG